MVKKFIGTNIEELITEIDTWMIENHASFYGSKAIRKRDLPNGAYEFIVSVKL